MSHFPYWRYDFIQNEIQKFTWDRPLISIDEISNSFANGVYTTLRTRESKYALQLSAHLSRLVESFGLNGSDFTYNINQLRPILRTLLQPLPGEEKRVRLHIPFSEPQFCYILIEELKHSDIAAYQKGVAVKTNCLSRKNPVAKQTSFIELSRGEKDYLRTYNLEESLIINKQGKILEGLSSNFFAVENGVIFTAGEGVLHGVTRNIILESAVESGFEIILNSVNYDEISHIDEAFITSTSRMVMPLVKIDSVIIGDGKPGPITIKIMKLFEEQFDKQFELI